MQSADKTRPAGAGITPMAKPTNYDPNKAVQP